MEKSSRQKLEIPLPWKLDAHRHELEPAHLSKGTSARPLLPDNKHTIRTNAVLMRKPPTLINSRLKRHTKRALKLLLRKRLVSWTCRARIECLPKITDT